MLIVSLFAVHETIDGNGPGGADIGGKGATDGLGTLETEVDVPWLPDMVYDVIDDGPIEQLPPLLLLVHGANEWGGMPPRPIIPSGGPMGRCPPIPCDIIPGGGGPPPLRCIGWCPPFIWWWGPIGPTGPPIPFMGGQCPPIEGGQPPFIGGNGRSWNKWKISI